MNIRNIIKEQDRARIEAQYAAELAPKSPYEKYGAFVGAIVALTYICQAGSAVSSYSYFSDLIGESVQNSLLTLVCVLLVIGTIETLKRIFVNVAFTDFYTDRLHGGSGANVSYLLAGALLVCSVYFSVIGGAKLINPDTAKIEAETVYDAEIQELRKEIADIMHRNTYKGQTWVKSSEQPILTAKETQLHELRAKKEAYEHTLRAEKETKQTAMFWAFGLIDALLIALTLFVYHYKYSVVQYAAAETEARTYAKPYEYAAPAFTLRQEPDLLRANHQDKPQIGFHALRQERGKQAKTTAPLRQDVRGAQDKTAETVRQDVRETQDKTTAPLRQDRQTVRQDSPEHQDKTARDTKTRLTQFRLFDSPKPIQDIEGLRAAIAAGERKRDHLTRFGVNITQIEREISRYQTEVNT
jgi:hypothetical protein